MRLGGSLRATARDHGMVGVVVLGTALAVLLCTTIADATESTSRHAAIGSPTTQPPAATPADSSPTSTVTGPGGAGGASGRSGPTASGGSAGGTASTVATGDASNTTNTPPSPTTTTAPPIPTLPPGALSPVNQLINQACVLALTPFGLPSTILGLLGMAIPITLPNLPFAIIVTPISDLCLQLQNATG